MPSTNETDRLSYERWQVSQQTRAIVAEHTESPLDRTSDYWRHIIAAYLYFRSRLFAPGRAYDSEDDGMLAIGGSAHCDVMDLDVKLGAASPEAKRTAVEWMLDSSPDDVAYWRKLGRGVSVRSTYRRRTDLVERLAA